MFMLPFSANLSTSPTITTTTATTITTLTLLSLSISLGFQAHNLLHLFFDLPRSPTPIPCNWDLGPRPHLLSEWRGTMMKSDDISTSEITLTSGIDGVSDYQQYLEKTSRRNSRGDPSLAQSSPTGNGEIQRHNSLVGTPTPTLDKEVQLAVPGIPMLEGRRPAHARKERKMRPHRVDAAEDPHEYPGPLALSFLTVGICLSVFLVSLDRTIVATVRAYLGNLGTRSSKLIPFPSRPYRASPTIFTPLTMLAGTAARTWSQLALSSLSMGVYSSCST